MVDVLDLAAELIDLFTEGFEQGVQRLLAGLAEGLTLGLEDAAGQLFEFQLQLLATFRSRACCSSKCLWRCSRLLCRVE